MFSFTNLHKERVYHHHHRDPANVDLKTMTSSINCCWKPVRNKLIQLKEQFLFLHVHVLSWEERDRDAERVEKKNYIIKDLLSFGCFSWLPDIEIQIKVC